MSLWHLSFNIYPLALYLCRLNSNPVVELIFGEIGNIQWSSVPLVLGELRNMRNVKVLMQMGEGGGRGKEGTWKVLRNVIYCLLPPYSAFCISYVTQLSNIFPMRRRHGIILKGQCSLDKCFRNNFHDILLQKFTRVFHILALKESRNYMATICALNSCICTSKSGANQVRGSQVQKANMRKHFQTQKSKSVWPWYADLQIMR